MSFIMKKRKRENMRRCGGRRGLLHDDGHNHSYALYQGEKRKKLKSLDYSNQEKNQLASSSKSAEQKEQELNKRDKMSEVQRCRVTHSRRTGTCRGYKVGTRFVGGGV